MSKNLVESVKERDLAWKQNVDNAYLAREGGYGACYDLHDVSPYELFAYIEEAYGHEVEISEISTNGWEIDWSYYLSETLVVGGCWWSGHMYIQNYEATDV